MRYLITILSLFVSIIANSQVTDTQLRVRPDQDPDSILVMSNDTNSSRPTYRTGKWRKLSGLIGSVAGDSDWLRYRTGTTPNNTDTMYHISGPVIIGSDTVENVTGGFGKSALNVVGVLDLRFPNYGGTNIAIGSGALDVGGSTTNNFALGQDVLNAATGADYNIGIGNNALLIATSGDFNVAIGSDAMSASTGTSSQSNVSVGYRSAYLGNTTAQNVLLGAQSGYNGCTSFNTIIGYQAGYSTPVSSNVFIGYQSGRLNTGSGNVFIGKESGENETGSNLLYIDNSNSATPLIGGDFAADTLRINGDLSIRDAVSGASTDSVMVWTPSNGRVKMRNASAFGGATNLSIAQSGGTQVIQSSTGTDVGVRNLYGLLITEGATDTLHFRVDSSLFATTYDLTQIPISSLKAAAATNTINNANYAQEWQWNTLAGTTGLKLSSTSTAAASNAQKLFEISLSGANASSGQSTYGGYFSNTHTGTTSTNYALYGVATGAASANYGLYGTSNSSYTIGTSLGAGVSGRNSNGGIAIEGITTGGGIGVYAESPDGYASYSYTTNGTAAAVRNNWSTNSNYGSVLDIYRNTSNGSNGAAGIGGGIAFYTETSTGATPISNQIKSIWTTATHASRTSSMVFTGLNSGTEGDILTLKGTKQLQFHGYGTGGAFTASPVADLFVDASGNVVQGSMTGQSWLADGDDATAAALISNQTFKITGGSGYTGITTDLFDNAATDSIVIQVNGDKFNTVTTPEADDYVLLHDENGAGADVNEKILWSDLYSLIGTDGNGIYDGSGTVPTSTTATLTDNITLNAGASEADLFIDGTNDLVGIGTNSPEEQLTISNEDSNLSYPIMGFHTDQTASGSAVLGETKYYYGTEDLVRIKAAKQTSAGTNDAELTITMEDASNAAINAVQYDYEENYTFDYPRQRLFGGVQMARVDSLDASTTLDESYYAVRATTSGITITLINANTTNGEFIGMQYIIFNDSGANITINPGGTNDYVNGSNADITLADKAGYMLTLMFTTGFNTNHWVGFKTP